MSDDVSEPEKHGTPPLEDVDLNSPEEGEKIICTNGDSEEVEEPILNGIISIDSPTSESEDSNEASDLKKNLTALLNDKSLSPTKSNSSSDVTDELMSEVDAELHENVSQEFETLQQDLGEEKAQCERLRAQNAEMDARMMALRQENKGYADRLKHQADDHIHAAQVKELEQTIVQLQRESKDSQEKLVSHDAAAKRAIGSLQNELKQRLDNAQRMLDEARREKESMVMKYALAEQKNIEAADRVHKMEAHVRDVNKERDQMLGHCRQMKADKTKAVDAYESKLGEVASLRRDIDKLKDLVETQEVKTKWAQNKLKAELEMHKETKAKVDELQRRVLQSKEESEQIRQDCQAMIRTYQESEEIKSNSLDLQLKAKLTELEAQQRAKKDQHQVHSALESQLDTLRAQHREVLRDLKAYRDKTQCLDADRICQEQTLEQCRSTIQAQKSQIKDMETSLTTLRDVQQRLTDEQEKATNLSQRLNELEHTNKELSVDIDGCGRRESEHLEFTEKISNKNAHLQSENTALQAKLDAICAELEKNLTQNDQLTDAKQSLEKQLSEEKKCRTKETNQLTQQLEQKTKIAEELGVQVEDEKDSLRTLKRRQQANIKDLTRQLQQAKKRLETLEPRGGGSTGDRDSVSMGSMGSRASSTGSLDRAGQQAAQASRESSQEPSPQEDCPPIVEYVEVDKQMLLEKIVRLQRTHARKSEKIEFMEDHINQLLNEVQKKAKIIQHYALGLEPGALTSELMDKNKLMERKAKVQMVLSKKGGIMASLYSQHSQDGSMNLDLSLQINRKLQAVLEDTLLKNITLKDNLDTLGQEIARLSQENRQIQLKLQALQSSKR